LSMTARCMSLFFLLVLSLSAFAQNAASPGQTVFKARCVMCHGADGQANTTMGRQLNALSLLSDEVKKLSADEMKQVVTEGKGSMPSFADQLTPEEITEVVAYVRSLEKNKK
jgi:cytochrome c6